MSSSDDTVTAAPPLIEGGHDFGTLTDLVCGLIERPTPRWWWIALAVCGTFFALGGLMTVYVISTGIGVWGMNQTVGWAFDITNFVFWVGIGHAGTLISAILFLFRQKWRSSLNRFAEAMTLFAVACAGLFVTIHLGRVWVFWYLVPAPSANEIYPNFRSPLSWDFAAVATYATVSTLFWYYGLIPDFATVRDRATGWFRRRIYGLLALGWRGSARHWHNYETGYLMLAGLATPLVVSVHTIVSFDFATSVIPGWHTTIFPPYFVTGAIFSGLAMVITLIVPLRILCGLQGSGHDAAPREHVQAHPGHGAADGLRLLDRGRQRLVRRQPLTNNTSPATERSALTPGATGRWSRAMWSSRSSSGSDGSGPRPGRCSSWRSWSTSGCGSSGS